MRDDRWRGAGGTDPAALVRAHTRLAVSPLVPEVRLHLAGEVFDLWERTRRADGRDEVPPPFWAFPWAGGLALARHLLDHPGVVAGKRVWDLAAGSGLVAIAAARAGAAAVDASDIDRYAVAAIGLNAAANGVRVAVRREDALGVPDTRADVVVAGDVFYDATIAPRALAFLGRLHARGARVLIGDPGRAHLPQSRLVPLAAYDVRGTAALEASAVTRATVWRLV